MRDRDRDWGFHLSRALPLSGYAAGMITHNWIQAAISGAALFIGYAILEASRERGS